MSLNILKNVKLAEYTSWLIGGPADFLCLPKTTDELHEALQFAKSSGLPITILGGGSNVLISDEGVRGLVICLRQFSEIKVEVLFDAQTKKEKLQIECLSGTAKSELLKIFLKYQLAPALFLAGLPGDVGGGVVMNAGVAENYEPREFMQLVDEIDVISVDGAIKTIQKKDLKIKYRHTDGWQPNIILKVRLSWPLDVHPEILKQVREANKARLSKQPLDKPSCGSVFKNPEGYKAAQLIDQCGLKGFRIGGSQVSLKHANFIVNLVNDSEENLQLSEADRALLETPATNVWNIIQHVQKTVFEKTGVQLTTEVQRLGEWSF